MTASSSSLFDRARRVKPIKVELIKVDPNLLPPADSYVLDDVRREQENLSPSVKQNTNLIFTAGEGENHIDIFILLDKEDNRVEFCHLMMNEPERIRKDFQDQLRRFGYFTIVVQIKTNYGCGVVDYMIRKLADDMREVKWMGDHMPEPWFRTSMNELIKLYDSYEPDESDSSDIPDNLMRMTRSEFFMLAERIGLPDDYLIFIEKRDYNRFMSILSST